MDVLNISNTGFFKTMINALIKSKLKKRYGDADVCLEELNITSDEKDNLVVMSVTLKASKDAVKNIISKEML